MKIDNTQLKHISIAIVYSSHFISLTTKVGCLSPMLIWSEFRMGKHRADDYQEDAPDFITYVQDLDIKITLRFIRLQLQRWLALFSNKFWWKVYHLVRKKIKKKDWKKSQGRSKSLEQFMFYFWWLCFGVDSILRHHSQIHLESKEFQHLLDPYSLLFQEKIVNYLYKLGCVVRMVAKLYSWSLTLYFSMRNAGQMTIRKTHPV